jgi:hypothetical protein
VDPERARRERGVEGLEDAVLLGAVAGLGDDRGRDAGPRQRLSQEARQEGADAVGLDRDGRHVVLRQEADDLGALLGRLVLRRPGLDREVEHAVEPAPAVRVREDEGHDARVARLAPAPGGVPPAVRPDDAPPVQAQRRARAGLGVDQLGLVGAQPVGVEPPLGEVRRLQHHLAPEAAGPGRAPHALDRVQGEALGPGARPIGLEHRHREPPEAV